MNVTHLTPVKIWRIVSSSSRRRHKLNRKDAAQETKSFTLKVTSVWSRVYYVHAMNMTNSSERCTGPNVGGGEVDPWDCTKMMWYHIIKDVQEAASIWSNCDDRREMAFTHRP